MAKGKKVKADFPILRKGEPYRELFEMAADALLVVDDDTLQILEANPSAELLYGYPREELLQMKATDISAEPKKTRAVIQKGKREKFHSVSLRWHRRKNGTIFPVEIRARHFLWQGRLVHFAAIRDITEKLSSQKALEESEARYRALFDFAGDAVCLIKNGIIVQCNPKALSFFGLEENALLGCTFWEMSPFFQPDGISSKTKASNIFRKAEKGEIHAFEWQFQRKDGSLLDTEVGLSTFWVGNDPYFLAILRDITVRKKNEGLLKLRVHQQNVLSQFLWFIGDFQSVDELYQYLALTLKRESNAYAFVLAEYVPQKEGFQIQLSIGFEKIKEIKKMFIPLDHFEPEYLERLKSRKLFPIGKNLSFLVQGKILRRQWRMWEHDLGIQSMYLMGISGEGTLYGAVLLFYKTKSGPEHPFFIESIINMAGVGIQRIYAQETLRSSEERYRRLFEHIQDVYFETDEKGGIQEISPSIEPTSKFRFIREELLGESFASLWADAKMYRGFWTTLFHIGFVLEFELPLLAKHSDVVPCRITAKVILSKKGECTGVIGSFRDITRQKANEQKLKQTLQDKEMLLREIHHRVKNNLQVIMSLLNLGASQLDEPRVLQLLEESSQRIRSMAMIHEQLYHSEDLSHIDFRNYIQSLVSELFGMYSLGDRIVCKTHIDPITLNIEMAIPCGLILNELLTNALKHAFPGQRDGEIEITFKKQKDQYVLIFSDNGIGLPHFSRIENSKSMGLLLVHVLSQQLGGKLRIVRKQGTTFRIAFPVEKKNLQRTSL